MASASPDVYVTTIERDETRYMECLKNVKKCGLDKKINVVYQDALEVNLSNVEYDLIFIDAAKVEQTKDNPYMYAWNFLPSKYNTRNKNNLGLPVGPICNPSLSSIKAALNPSDTNYVYFYADINTGKVYFSEDYAGFVDIQKKLGV